MACLDEGVEVDTRQVRVKQLNQDATEETGSENTDLSQDATEGSAVISHKTVRGRGCERHMEKETGNLSGLRTLCTAPDDQWNAGWALMMFQLGQSSHLINGE
ncbi:hypothetical protein F2P79_008690 [Pimephales promelas]|nr:hypothetical protein F2P79_008690 [Pimephales promelas]